MFRKPQQQRPPAIADDIKEQEQGARSGQTSTYSCPDCGGVLWQLDEKSVPHFQCHVGHRYGPDELVVAKSRALEQALYEAVRGLKEKAMLLRQLSVRANPASPATAYLIEQ